MLLQQHLFVKHSLASLSLFLFPPLSLSQSLHLVLSACFFRLMSNCSSGRPNQPRPERDFGHPILLVMNLVRHCYMEFFFLQLQIVWIKGWRQASPLKVGLNIGTLSTKTLNITSLQMTVTEILSVCILPTVILLVTKMENIKNAPFLERSNFQSKILA